MDNIIQLHQNDGREPRSGLGEGNMVFSQRSWARRNIRIRQIRHGYNPEGAIDECSGA
jgi:hypothetical protein